MASIWHDSPSSPLLNSLGTHHTLARRGQWVCGWAHASSPWMQMTRRGIISSMLSLLSSLSKNGMFCLNIVLKMVFSRRGIGLPRRLLLAWTRRFCDSKLFEKAVCIGKLAVREMVAKGTIELLTQRHTTGLKTLFSSLATWKRKQMSQRKRWNVLRAC